MIRPCTVDQRAEQVLALARWWESQFWRQEDFVSQSPWSAGRLHAAFSALADIYRERETRTALMQMLPASEVGVLSVESYPLWFLLSCPWLYDSAALTQLGLDATDADVLRHPKLVTALRSQRYADFHEARFKLRCLAAMRNVTLAVEYQPQASTGEGTADFCLHLAEPLLVNAQFSIDDSLGVDVVGYSLARAAVGLPNNKASVIVLDIETEMSSLLLHSEVQRWFDADGEGVAFPNIVGVIVVSRERVEPWPGICGEVEALMPLWRSTAPPWVVEGPWNAIGISFAVNGYEVLAKRHEDARQMPG